MAEAKRPPLPLILTANDLLEGGTVYYSGAGWTSLLADALVATDDYGGHALQTMMLESEANGVVVEPYLATVKLDTEGRPLPVHYRERIRIVGPTFRDDFGRNDLAGAI